MANPFKALGQLGNIGQMMGQYQQMMAEMKQMQQEMERMEITGSAGGEMVQATVTGTGKMIRIRIAPEAADPSDVEMLEDLVASAVRAAQDNAERYRQQKMEEITSRAGIDPSMLGGMLDG